MKMGPLDSAWTSAPAPRDTLAVRRYPLDQVVLMHFGCPLSAVQHTAPVHDSSDMFCNDGRRQKHCCVEQGSSRFHRPLHGVRSIGVSTGLTRPAGQSQGSPRRPRRHRLRITLDPVACAHLRTKSCPSPACAAPGPAPAQQDHARVQIAQHGRVHRAAQVAQSLAPQVHIAQLVVARQPQPQPMRPSDWRAPLMMHSPASSPSGTRPSPAPCAGRARRTSNAARADRDRRAVRLRSAG